MKKSTEDTQFLVTVLLGVPNAKGSRERETAEWSILSK